MGNISERLRALDDRVLSTRGIRAISTVLLAGGLGLIVFFAVTGPRGEPGPLGFSCFAAEQRVVERVLGTPVGSSNATGGEDSRQAVGVWNAEGEPLIEVTCTSVTPEELVDARPQTEDEGYVAGDPPMLLQPADDPDFASTVTFTYSSAVVVMQLARPVDEDGARELVESWERQVKMFDSSR